MMRIWKYFQRNRKKWIKTFDSIKVLLVSIIHKLACVFPFLGTLNKKDLSNVTLISEFSCEMFSTKKRKFAHF